MQNTVTIRTLAPTFCLCSNHSTSQNKAALKATLCCFRQQVSRDVRRVKAEIPAPQIRQLPWRRIAPVELQLSMGDPLHEFTSSLNKTLCEARNSFLPHGSVSEGGQSDFDCRDPSQPLQFGSVHCTTGSAMMGHTHEGVQEAELWACTPASRW